MNNIEKLEELIAYWKAEKEKCKDVRSGYHYCDGMTDAFSQALHIFKQPSNQVDAIDTKAPCRFCEQDGASRMAKFCPQCGRPLR